MTTHEIMKDGGLKSRKLLFSLYATFLILLGAIISAKSALFAANYPTFVSGITAIAGLYLAGSVANKWTTLKHLKPDEDKPDDEEEKFQFGDKYKEDNG